MTHTPSLALAPADGADVEYATRLLETAGLPADDVRADDVELFVGRLDGRRIGVGGLERYGTRALLRSVVVEDEHRGDGHGKRLCVRLLDRAADRGVTEVYLLTTTPEGFFAALGFDPVERAAVPDSIRSTREFSALCPESAVCMRRPLE